MTLEEQFFTLLVILISSFIIGVLFDGYRVLFEKLNIIRWVILICDICFGVFSAVFIFRILLWSNNGQLRLIILVAFFIGLLLYYLILSNSVVAFWLYVYNIINKIIKVFFHLINTLIIKPLKIILDIIVVILKRILIIIKPISYLLKRIDTICKNIFIFKPKRLFSNLKLKRSKKEGLFSLLKKLFKKNNR